MTTDRAAQLMLVAMAVCFGGTWVAADVAVAEAPPFAIALVRFALASVLLAAWAGLTGRRLAPIGRSDWPLIAGLGLTAIAGYNWLFLTGLTLAPASDGAILVPGLAPVFTAVLAAALLGDRLGRRGAAGLALAAIGLVMVVSPAEAGSDRRLLGDALFVGGALLWAAYNVVSKLSSRRFDAVSATLYGTALGTVVLVPLAVMEGGLHRLPAMSLPAMAGTLYLAVFGTVAAFVLLNVGVARIGAARASAFALLVPIIGVLSSVWLLGDRIGPLTALGGAAVLAGLWLIQRPAQPTAATVSPPSATPTSA